MVRDITLIQNDEDDYSVIIKLDENNQCKLEVYKGFSDIWTVQLHVQARGFHEIPSHSWDGKLVSVIDDATDGIPWDRARLQAGQASLTYYGRPDWITIGDHVLALHYDAA